MKRLHFGTADIAQGFLILVNPCHPVKNDAPGDRLVTLPPPGGHILLERQTATMLWEALSFLGCGEQILPVSGYRTMAEQRAIYSEALAEHGEDFTRQYVALPGCSEHQTGLCMDMHNVDVGKQETFNNTPAARWLEENAYRFGFILRYPAGKEHITGAVYESWHFRFVGRTLATYLHDNGLTLDEYYAGNHDAYNK